MNRFLLDVSVVPALLDPRHEFHDAAHAWAAGDPGARRLTCPVVQNGVVRIASQPGYPNHLGTAARVRATLGAFCAGARHEFCPDDISVLDDTHVARPASITPANVTDVHLLALARHHGARLATFDRRIPVDAVPGGAAALAVIVA